MRLDGTPDLVRRGREAEPPCGVLYDLDVDESVDSLPIQTDFLQDLGIERVPAPRAEIVQYALIGFKELLHRDRVPVHRSGVGVEARNPRVLSWNEKEQHAQGQAQNDQPQNRSQP